MELNKEYLHEMAMEFNKIPRSFLDELCGNEYLGERSEKQLIDYATEKIFWDEREDLIKQMEDVCNREEKGEIDDPFGINTYPFGKKTDEVYSKFVGICAGEMALNSIFKAVDSYCRSVISMCPTTNISQEEFNEMYKDKDIDESQIVRFIDRLAPFRGNTARENLIPPKTVMLFTDKWDDKVFSEYEDLFLDYAKSGVMFYFILVTRYGMSEITFLPKCRIH